MNYKNFIRIGLITFLVGLSACTTVEKLSSNQVKDWKPFNENGEMIRTDRNATGKVGVVSTSKYEASKIGREILMKGGNAIDAAVAAGFALGVAEPNSSGLGGGGFMVVRSAKTGETTFIDFRERAPRNSAPEMWKLDENGKVIGNQKVEGGKAAGIPGEVAGLLYALENYGTMSREQVIRPAVNLAKNGFVVTPTLSGDMKNQFDKLEKYPETAKVFLNEEGLPYEAGDKFINKDMAKTLELIIKKGKDGFYKGEVAEAIVNTLNKYDGVFTLEDLANYKPIVKKPVNGKPFMVLGSPGGTKIISTVSQVISRVIDHKMGMQEAIDVPRLYDNTANKIGIETRVSDETIKKLEEMGHTVVKTSDWDRGMGSVQGVLYKEDGTLEGGADPRRDGKALGY